MTEDMVTEVELRGLPAEVIRELKISPSRKLCREIVQCMEEVGDGGRISLDKLIIMFYRTHNKILKRKDLVAKLYRMKQMGLVSTPPGLKGVYEPTKNRSRKQ